MGTEYKIEIVYDSDIELYSVAVNDIIILSCLSMEEVNELKAGDIIKFFEMV